MKYDFPLDRAYEGTYHMWLKRHPNDGPVVVGLDALGTQSIGGLAYVVLPEVGTQVRPGQPIGTLEAAKMTSELFAPIGGTVTARNEQVLRDPSLVNRDCYGEGWLLAIAPDDWAAASAALVHGPDLPAWIEAEIERYREQGWIVDAG